MIAISISFLQWLVCGLAAALLLDPSLRGRRLIGSSFLLGSGIAAFTLLALSLAGVRWTSVSATAIFGAITLGLWFGARARIRCAGEIVSTAKSSTAPDRIGAAVVDLVTLCLIAGHSVFATLSPVAEWDFWAIWGLKARVFFEHGGVDWTFLENPLNAFTHPDYPLLLPLDYAWITLLDGGWNDRWLGILTTAFGVGLLLILRDLFEEEFRGRALAALATLAVACFALSPWIGMAEGPLVALGTAGVLTIRRGFVREHSPSIALGSVLLGLAAFTKNEGLSLMVAAAAGAALALGARWRSITRLWPALAVAAPWVILRFSHGLQTDLTSGSVGERAARQLENVPAIAIALADNVPDEPLFWLGVVLAVLLFAPEAMRREKFLTVAVLVQVLFYIGAYVVTPNELSWHVASSWVRLLEQVAVAAGFGALAVLGRAVEGSELVEYPSAS